MKYYFAPMEGITDYIFRNVHQQYFPGTDKYYTPFFSPTNDGRFPPRNMRDFDPDVNQGVSVVPQLLTKYGIFVGGKGLNGPGIQRDQPEFGLPIRNCDG